MLVPLEHAAPCLPIISFKPVAVPAAESYLDDRGEKLRRINIMNRSSNTSDIRKKYAHTIVHTQKEKTTKTNMQYCA